MLKKILIVDDDRILVMLEKKIFQGLNFEVETAGNGLEAWEKLKTIKPDLILLDRIMPLMNGEEFLNLIKANFMTKEIPVIFISSSLSPEIKERLFLKGVNSIFHKPFDWEELIQKVQDILHLPNMVIPPKVKAYHQMFSIRQ